MDLIMDELMKYGPVVTAVAVILAIKPLRNAIWFLVLAVLGTLFFLAIVQPDFMGQYPAAVNLVATAYALVSGIRWASARNRKPG